MVCQIQLPLLEFYVIAFSTTTGRASIIIQVIQMVKVQDFQGAVFNPEDYKHFLHNNIQHLQTVPMSKSFSTSVMLSQGKLLPQQEPFFYIYRQIYLNHTSYGILAELSLQDYHQNKIKKHEKTLVRPGLNHQSYTKEHVGPVVVSHRRDQNLEDMIVTMTKSKPIFSEWNTKDGRQHSLWRLRASEVSLSERFSKIDCLYILDGHHRLEAAHQHYLLSDKTKNSDLWIQAVIYSTEYVMVYPQHRVVRDAPENMQIVNELIKLEQLEVTALNIQNLEAFQINLELENYEIMLKMQNRIYGINFKNTSRTILEQISAFRLHQQILDHFFDEELLSRLHYVPGIMSQEELFAHKMIFFVKKPEIEILFQLADQQGSMPPKSTWIEPKPCSHMVIRLLQKPLLSQ